MTSNEVVRGIGMLDGDGWIGRWSPGIGDLTVMGWLAVALYAVGAWQCLRLVTTRKDLLQHNEAVLWWLLVVGLFVLGINKLLDLQSALTEIGRIVATQQGWYENRHAVLPRFIYGVIGFAVFATLAMASFARKVPHGTLLALAGSVCLLAFVAIRAASFHRVDVYIYSELLGLKLNWILEAGGIGVIVAGVRWRLRGH
jgi:hypothetical protein